MNTHPLLGTVSGIVVVKDVDRIVFATDGASFDVAGKLVAPQSKVVLMPEQCCVLAQRGDARFAQRVRTALASGNDFDDVLAHIVDACETVHQAMKECLPRAPEWTIYLGGFSIARQRFETWSLRSRSGSLEASPGDGSYHGSEAFTLKEFDGALAAPMPSAQMLWRFNIVAGRQTLFPADELAIRLLCAARQHRLVGIVTGIVTQPPSVGIFVQLTELRRDKITSEIVHRWPDAIGEVIDPSRGEALPPVFQTSAEEPR